MNTADHVVLQSRIRAVRRKLFLRGAIQTLIHTGLYVLPILAAAVALDQRWGAGRWSVAVFATGMGLLLAAMVWHAARHWRSPLGAAVALDEEARLQDRVSSALEFLARPELMDEPRRLQVEDAIRHAETLNLRPLFRLKAPRSAFALPLFAVLLLLSFYIPPQLAPFSPIEQAAALQKAQQLSEIQALREEFKEEQKDEDIAEVLKKLQEIERRFDEGAMQEREVLIELARLDEQLRQKMSEMGVEQLESELNTLTPHLFASDTSRAVAQALKKQEMEEAAKEMEKVAEKVEKKELTEEQKKELARNMAVAASKMGEAGQNSFSGDLSEASKSLEGSDAKGLKGASKSMGDKFQKVGKYRNFSKMSKSLSMCKSCLGQPKVCSSCNGGGCKECNGTGLSLSKTPGYGEGKGKGKGGLKAGKGTADPLGDANRLNSSYREMLQVTGMAGEGPVESETEITVGKPGESQVEAKDLYAEYAAVAEQAIEQEEVPLSHRYHVKRYFQAIRPVE